MDRQRIFLSPGNTLHVMASMAVLALGMLPLCSAADLTIREFGAAEKWTAAYPVGNGRLGALPFGSFPAERILVNEETIWARGEPRLMPEDTFEHLEAVRKLEAAGDYAGADRYFVENIQNFSRPEHYQFAGWLELDYGDGESPRSTRRELDLETGAARTAHKFDDGRWINQAVMASAPDDLILVNVRSNEAIDLRVKFGDGDIEGSDIVFDGSAAGVDATRFRVRVRVLEGRITRAADGELRISADRQVTIAVAVATDLDRDRAGHKLEDGWQDRAVATLDRVAARSFKSLKKAAVTDHRRYFDRVSLDIGTSPDDVLALPMSKRLQRLRDGAHDDPDLIETYFQFGRYLLIASSRPGAFPANLQGVWNPHLKPPWHSDYHLNINVEMNYWPAETTNLSEMHEPLFRLIRYYQPTGREMARRMGMKGWAMGHASDIWGNARIMARTPYWGGSFFGGQWLTLHLLEHYRFNRDPRFLGAYWDVLTASVEFVESWLIPGPAENQLMARPSASPENSFEYTDADGVTRQASLSAGNSFDQFMVLQVFNDFLEAAEALGKSQEPLPTRIAALLPRVYRPQVGDDGRLMEWRIPFAEPEPGHRHMSHILGAYPGSIIDLDNDKRMRDAVVRSIEARLANGGGHTGWSRAWVIGLFARLADGDRAYGNLREILASSTFDNLWDKHPPFQIDGNFGATAAIAEMLLHSHGTEIRLLPALPTEWPTGEARGLRARGDITIDLRWDEHRLVEAVLMPGENAVEEVLVAFGDQHRKVSLKPGVPVTLRDAR